jgi:transposase
MNKKSGSRKLAANKLIENIRRKKQQTYSSEEKTHIVRGEERISALCSGEGIAESLYYSWSKEFLEAGKRRVSGDTTRQATSPEVTRSFRCRCYNRKMHSLKPIPVGLLISLVR